MPNQWNFTSATLNRIRFVFTTISKITKEIFVKICWQLKTPTRTCKCTRCIMQMSDLYASDFPFKTFCKLAQHGETIRKKCLRVQTTINHFYILTFLCFLPQYQRQRKCFFFQSASWKRHCATHWREQRGKDSSNFWLVRSEHAHGSYPGLSFRPPGFSPYRGREEKRVQGLNYHWVYPDKHESGNELFISLSTWLSDKKRQLHVWLSFAFRKDICDKSNNFPSVFAVTKAVHSGICQTRSFTQRYLKLISSSFGSLTRVLTKLLAT